MYLLFFSFVLFRSYLFFLYFYSFGIRKYIYFLTVNINKKILFFNRLWINKILSFFFFESYKNTYKLLDKNIFDVLGPFGIIYNIKKIMFSLIHFSTGLLYHYLGIILLFLLYILFIFF